MRLKLLSLGLAAVTCVIISSSSLAYIAQVAPQPNPDPVQSLATWSLPVRASIPITSCFGPRLLLGKFSGFHEGVDFGARLRTPVRAVASGRVIWEGFEGCSGRSIVIEHHPLPGNKVIFSIYRHLKGYAVKRGQSVKSGQIVAYSGASGKKLKIGQNEERRGCVMGPHLHLEFVELKAGAEKRDVEKTLRTGHLGDQTSYLDPGLFLASVREECGGISSHVLQSKSATAKASQSF